MAKGPAATPIFGDAYLADTTHLSTEEHGAYFLMILAAWRHPDCTLPDDEKKLANIARVTLKRWRSMAPTLMEFWTKEDGRIFQKRLRREHKWVAEKSRVNRSAAATRWSGQDTENKQLDLCERTSERICQSECETHAPPPPPTIESTTTPLDSPRAKKIDAVDEEENLGEKAPTRKPDLTAENPKGEELSVAPEGSEGGPGDLLTLTHELARLGGVAINPAFPRTLAREMDIVKAWKADGVDLDKIAKPAILEKLNATGESSIASLRFYDGAVRKAHAVVQARNGTSGVVLQNGEWPAERMAAYRAALDDPAKMADYRQKFEGKPH